MPHKLTSLGYIKEHVKVLDKKDTAKLSTVGE